MKLIAGLDLTTQTGWSVFGIDSGSLVASGVWDMTPAPGDHEGDRAVEFRVNMIKFVRRFDIGAIIFERPVIYPGIQYSTVRIAFGQASTVEEVAAINMIPTMSVPPMKMKKHVTGNGRARKPLVIRHVVRRTGPLVTEPGGRTKTEQTKRAKMMGDEADARGVALYALDRFDRLAMLDGRFAET